jgi:hypothetical protein
VVLKTVVDVEHDLAFPPREAAGRVLAYNPLFGNQPIAERGANRLQGRTGVVLFGHTIDGGFSSLFTVEDMDNENFFVSMDAVGRDPEGFPL